MQWPAVLALAICGWASATSVHAQANSTDPFLSTTPFHSWVGTKPKPQIPWSIKVLPTELSDFQRIYLRVRIQVKGRQVLRHVPEGGLAFMVQVTDAAGREFQDHAFLQPRDLAKDVSKGVLEVIENMLVVPGQYRLAFAVYDKGTGAYSFQERQVKVPGLKNDPLPSSWPTASSVEFFEPEENPFKVFLANPPVRLNLPLQTGRPIRLEVIYGFRTPPPAAGSTSYYNQWLEAEFSEISALAQIGVGNGSIRVEVVDALHRRMLFEQDDVRDLDWPRLQSAVAAIDPTRVDVTTLQLASRGVTFWMQELQKRFNQAALAAANGAQPLNVYVIMGGMWSSTGVPLVFPQGADCLVYYFGIRFVPHAMNRVRSPAGNPYAPGGAGDPLADILDNLPPPYQAPRPRPAKPRASGPPIPPLLIPLNPRAFQSTSPAEFRAVLARFLAELSAN